MGCLSVGSVDVFISATSRNLMQNNSLANFHISVTLFKDVGLTCILSHHNVNSEP